MKLKSRYSNKEEIPSAYIDLYKDVDGVWVLDVDGDDYTSEVNKLKQKVDEFRNENIDTRKRAEELEAQLESFKGIDPEKANEALAKLQEIKDKKLLDEGKIDELLANRTDAMRSDFEGKIEQLNANLKKLTSERDNFKNLYSNTVLDAQIQTAVGDVAALRQGALRDVVSRARETWSLDESGKLIPKRDGKVVYGNEGTNPLTMQEWVKGLYKEANYLFEPNSGGGAQGNGQQGGHSGEVVNIEDKSGLSANLEGIADGTVQVVS